MNEPLRLLFLEDSADDHRLEEEALRKAGVHFTSQRVELREDYVRAITDYRPDVILADYTLPQIDGPTALSLALEKCPDTPFIFVSGTIGEDRAVESLRMGASDYVVKDRLAGLAARVLRALREAKIRIERRHLEAELRQAQKMEALGHLAGGVAHDFNNLLTAILGYSAITLDQIEDCSPIRTNVLEIQRAGERAAALTRQLLAFSRRQPIQAKVLNLNEIILGLERMLRRVIPEAVHMELSLPEDLGSVRADPGQMDQIVMNLAINARDAMPKGGLLRIMTSNVELQPDFVARHPGSAVGPHVVLTVSDTGIGISKEHLPHLFEPFFTTKGEGKGTGLGLATIYGIAKQSRGFITVQSDSGKGSVFRVYFPQLGEKPQGSSDSRIVEIVWGTESILVTEDDPVILRLVRQCLIAYGYQVHEAKDPEEALSVAADEKIDLLLTDVVMPKMSGRELAATLRAVQPDLPVLYMTGYTEDIAFREGKLEKGSQLLVKPFTPTELLTKLRKALRPSRGVKSK
jgi:two-component system, cell cycle sensor histidine kinase and response regulator CckA